MSVPQAQHHTSIPVQDQGSRVPNERRLHAGMEVQAAAQVCEDKKGENTRILALDPVDAGLADFFLVTSALNDRQALTIADEVELRLKRDFGVLPASVEGRRHGEWILLDYVDFVVHVFQAERRAYYDIERLRKSARPFTPAQFDQELKAELAAKTGAARDKAMASSSKKSGSGKAARAKSQSLPKKTAARPTSKPAAKSPRLSARKKTSAKK